MSPFLQVQFCGTDICVLGPKGRSNDCFTYLRKEVGDKFDCPLYEMVPVAIISPISPNCAIFMMDSPKEIESNEEIYIFRWKGHSRITQEVLDLDVPYQYLCL